MCQNPRPLVFFSKVPTYEYLSEVIMGSPCVTEMLSRGMRGAFRLLIIISSVAMVKSRHIVGLAFMFISLTVFGIANLFKSHNRFPIRCAPDTMSISHTVLFQFKAEAMVDDVKAVSACVVH